MEKILYIKMMMKQHCLRVFKSKTIENFASINNNLIIICIMFWKILTVFRTQDMRKQVNEYTKYGRLSILITSGLNGLNKSCIYFFLLIICLGFLATQRATRIFTALYLSNLKRILQNLVGRFV